MKSTSLRKIRQKVRFLGNFQKMTRSVSLISAVRFKRVNVKIQKILLVGYYLLSLLKEILKRNSATGAAATERSFANLSQRQNSVLVIVIGSDRGLAGAFDLNIFQKANKLIKEFKNQDLEFKSDRVLIGTIGRKAENYFKKCGSLLFSFSRFEDLFPENFAQELVSYLRFLIENEKLTQIMIVKPNLTSAGYVVETVTVYPFSAEFLEETINNLMPKTKEWLRFGQGSEPILEQAWVEYKLEPSPAKLMEVILKQSFFLVIYITILQAQASLELARTITMRKAFDNSTELIKENMLEYNKLRQNKITQELLDIIR